MQAKIFRRDMRGMTLVELMIVVAVVAILATLAVGSYRRYTIRANRTDGTMALLRIQAAEEKYFLQNNAYTATLASLNISSPTANGYYSLSIAGNPTIATSYLATATPAGSQASGDPSCPTITIDDQGQHGPAATAATCWH
jgi:type IV pilus assembly protein PilE